MIPGIFDGGFDAVAAFFDGRIRQPDRCKLRQSLGCIDLDEDRIRFHPDDAHAVDFNEHNAFLYFLGRILTNRNIYIKRFSCSTISHCFVETVPETRPAISDDFYTSFSVEQERDFCPYYHNPKDAETS